VLKGGKDSTQRFGLQHPRRYIWRLKTEMQRRELYSQTRKKACDAPAIKSSRPKKPVLTNLNQFFSDSSSGDDSADERNICDDSDGGDAEFKEENCLFCGEFGMDNKCGSCAQFMAYGLTRFVLDGIAQKDILAICV
jgi:hypothetical protein